MARIRAIKPQFFRSADVAGLPSDACRITWIGLWTYCDDSGRGVDDSRLVKGEIWPLHDKVTAKTVESHLTALSATVDPLICRYEANGRRYLHVVKWKEHQKINRPQPSVIPPCPAHETSEKNHGHDSEDSVNDTGTLTDRSRQEGNKEGEWKGKGKEGNPRQSSSDLPTRPSSESDDDDGGTVGQALRILAEQDLADREATKGPVRNREAWLTKAVRVRRDRHGDQLVGFEGLSAEEIVAALDPPVDVDPGSESVAAFRALAARSDLPHCEECDDSGWVTVGDGPAVAKCGVCRRLIPEPDRELVK